MVIDTYFAAWNGSLIHWFRQGKVACGYVPDDDATVYLPPEPILECRHCIKAIRKRDASE